MQLTKSLALAFFAASALTVPALAQTMGESMMKDGTMMVMMPDGRMSTMQSSDKMMSDAMMKDGKPMTTTHMMMMSGGKVYMAEDKKMSDGKMMSEHMMMKK